MSKSECVGRPLLSPDDQNGLCLGIILMGCDSVLKTHLSEG